MFVKRQNKRHQRQAAKLFATSAEKPSSLTLSKAVVSILTPRTPRTCGRIELATDRHLLSDAYKYAGTVAASVQAL